MSLSEDSKIYVAGHRGLVGSAIWNNLRAGAITILWEEHTANLTSPTRTR